VVERVGLPGSARRPVRRPRVVRCDNEASPEGKKALDRVRVRPQSGSGPAPDQDRVPGPEESLIDIASAWTPVALPHRTRLRCSPCEPRPRGGRRGEPRVSFPVACQPRWVDRNLRRSKLV
jgi:hypothetical protein